MSTVVGVRLDAEELARLDAVRGTASRSSWTRDAVLAALAAGPPPERVAETKKRRLVKAPPRGQFACCAHCRHPPVATAHGEPCVKCTTA